MPANSLRDQFCSGKISASEIAKDHLAKIGMHNQTLGAFLSVFESRIMKKAADLDEKRRLGKPLGKMAGIPVALKDNIHVMGELTTCGSRILESYKAVFDATVTRRLEEEDALIIGKTNLDEFAMGSSTENSAFHPTKNPWDLACSSGGSSGGSAAAVSARLVPIAFGSDTGGSIRQPAAFCGVSGFKPTYGRVSRFGLVAFGSSLDQIGPFGTTPRDIALAMEVIGHPCNYDSTSLHVPQESYSELIRKEIKGQAIGVPYKLLQDLQPDVARNFEESLKAFQNMGCTLVDIDLDLLKHSVSIYYILATAEASTNLARFDGIRYGIRSPKAHTVGEIYDLSRTSGFGAEVKRRIMLGTYVLSAGFQDAYYKKAQKVRTLIIQSFKKAFQKCAIIATPTAPTATFEIGSIQEPLQMYQQDIFTIPANLAGLPAISVPSGFNAQGRPLGLHLTGPQMHDADVLTFAHHFEETMKFGQKAPKL
jgi:aspartyl-tRNA(Asn)/glutamyl-tRNA(Gln) amidotransferase subunit A